jgi:predicted glycosyltransferase
MAEKASSPKRILVAPLDWGLGHATRCIPVIRELLETGCEVVIGADGAPARLLAEEFPSLERVTLPGYGIRYAPSAAGLAARMIAQLPAIARAIRRERRALRSWLATHRLDAIISDNRFGLHVPGIPSVIMTHQLEIRSPFGALSQRLLRRVNYRYIGRFDECWVVDFPGAAGLAGELSHPSVLPSVPVQYLGCLSRLKPGAREKRLDLTVVISGPEPQRTLFNDMIDRQVRELELRVLVVRGLPGDDAPPVHAGRVTTVSHLGTRELGEALAESRLVLCRAGYTSVMELVSIGQKAFLVPTPGQTEQEYLAGYLTGRGYFPSAPQKGFRLQDALSQAAAFPFRAPEVPSMDGFREVIKRFVSSL